MTARNWILGTGAFLLGTVALAQGKDRNKDAEVDFRKTVNLSPQETLVQANKYQLRMTETESRVNVLMDQARKKRDIVKLNCVSDKLQQLKGLQSVTDISMKDLNTAISRADDAARQHEYTRITILYQKVLVLGTESENCIGEDVSYVGATVVDVEIDPSVPTTDPTAIPTPVPDVTRPQEASPFI